MWWKQTCKCKCGSSLDCVVKSIESRFSLKVDSYLYKKVDFMDGSLDLTEPGRMYPQVITPGYKILTDIAGDGKRLFHSTLDGKLIKENPDTGDY